MKRKVFTFILILLTLAISCFCVAYADEEIPAEIKTALSNSEIEDTAYWSGSDSTWFVLSRTEEGLKALHCFTLEGSGWMESFSTSAAIPQDENRTSVYVSDQSIRYFPEPMEVFEGPILIINHHGNGVYEDSALITFAYQRTNPDE